jgi:hypothetical protein
VFAKLAVLTLCLGLGACALLSLRQMRTQAAHELAEARLRVLQRDNEFWRLRTRIAARVTPEHIEQLAQKINPLKPMATELAPSALAGPLPDSPR